MKMQLQFFSRPTKEDTQYEGVGKPINLSADVISLLPEAGEKIRLFEYLHGVSYAEWVAYNLKSHPCIVDYTEKVFQELKNGEIEMRLHIFVTPVEE